MGFFDRFRKPELETEIRELAPSDIGEWIAREFGPRENEARKDLEMTASEIMSGVTKLQASLKELEKTRFRGDPRLDPRINMIKDAFVTKALSGLAALPSVKMTETRDFRKILTDTRKTLNESAAVTQKQGYVLSNYFKERGKHFSDAFQDVDGKLDMMQKALNGKYSFMTDLESIRHSLNELQRGNDEIAFVGERAKNLELEIKEKRSLLEGRKKELVGLSESALWKSAEKQRKEIEFLGMEVRELENAIRAGLASVSRPLKKMSHETGEASVLALADRPFEAFMATHDREITDIFRSACESIKKGGLEVKESDKKHMKDVSSRLDYFFRAKERIGKAAKEIETKESALSSSDAFRRESELKEAIAFFEKELASLVEEQSSARAGLGKAKGKIETHGKRLEETIAKHGWSLKL